MHLNYAHLSKLTFPNNKKCKYAELGFICQQDLKRWQMFRGKLNPVYTYHGMLPLSRILLNRERMETSVQICSHWHSQYSWQPEQYSLQHQKYQNPEENLTDPITHIWGPIGFIGIHLEMNLVQLSWLQGLSWIYLDTRETTSRSTSRFLTGL